MFEAALAKRYILSQKRHSILTICSIAAALALMAFLFTGFSTVYTCVRNYARLNGSYHYRIYDISKESAEKIRELTKDVAECNISHSKKWSDSESGIDAAGYTVPEEYAYNADLYFTQYMGNINPEHDLDAYIEELCSKAETPPPMTDEYSDGDTEYVFSYGGYTANRWLIDLDLIDLQSRYTLIRTFAIFYIAVIFLAVALRLIIDTSFEISSKEREKQFGLLQSIGATPRQIVSVMTFEGLFLSVIGLPIGIAAGVGITYAAFRIILSIPLLKQYLLPEEFFNCMKFSVSPLLIAIAAVTGLVWVLLSAYGTGMRVIKMSPIQAISARSNKVKKVKSKSGYQKIFGWKGKLAARNNHRQPKRYIITVISLTISITLIAVFPTFMQSGEAFVNDNITSQYSSFNAGPTDLGVVFADTSEYFTDKDTLFYHEPMKKLENSGYFKDIFQEMNMIYTDTDNMRTVHVIHLNECAYNNFFNGKPPVTYDELNASGGEIYIESDGYPDAFSPGDTVKCEINTLKKLTKEEYSAIPPEDRDAQMFEDENGEKFYCTLDTKYPELKVTASVAASKTKMETADFSEVIFLIGTMEQYDSAALEYHKENSYENAVVECNLKNISQYREVLKFLEDNDIYLLADHVSSQMAVQAFFLALSTLIRLMTAMFAAIAIINMVNILSTGVLNRKREIAAMQSLGMSQRQLFGMTAVECLQYCLTAGIASLLLTGIIIIGTLVFLDNVLMISEALEFFSFVQPLLLIAVSLAAAFVIALAASYLPLRRMQKGSLSEEMRSID